MPPTQEIEREDELASSVDPIRQIVIGVKNVNHHARQSYEQLAEAKDEAEKLVGLLDSAPLKRLNHVVYEEAVTLRRRIEDGLGLEGSGSEFDFDAVRDDGEELLELLHLALQPPRTAEQIKGLFPDA